MTRNEVRAALLDQTVTVEGDTWTVGGVGVLSDDGSSVYLHLWSTTRIVTTQRNGRNIPVQSCGFYPLSDVLPQA